jgi:hypothetical protein
MPSVQEILRQTGFSDQEINAIDERARVAFTNVLTQAEADRQAAELAYRANSDFYEQKIVPAMTDMDTERQRLENERIRAQSEVAFYREQNEAARQAGFVASDAPGFQPRDGQGRYVPGPSGSPQFSGGDEIETRLVNGLSNIGWAMQTYQRLHNGVLPDDIDKLAEEATRSGRPFRDYVSSKYDFAGKQRELQQKQQQEHDDRIRRDAVAERDKVWAERTGNNPDIRPAAQAQYTEVRRAVDAGQRADPLKLTDRERTRVTRQQIRERISAQESEG